MKIISFLLIITGVNFLFSQTFEEVEKIIHEVELTKFTDSVSTSEIYHLNFKPVEIIGYLKNDTLIMSTAIYSDLKKVVHTYYDKFKKTPIYVREIDCLSNKLIKEVYGLSYHSYKTLEQPLEEYEINANKVYLEAYNFSSVVGFALVDRKALKYTFTGKLVEEVEMTPPCGREAFAIVHKYKVLNTDYPNYNQKYVLLIQPCPEFHKNNFFKKKKIYKIDSATNSGVTFNHAIFNEYDKVDLPIFWVREIEKLNK